MTNAEKLIREEISNVERLGNPIKPVVNDIKLAYFHGYISDAEKNTLLAELNEADRLYNYAREKRHEEFMKKQKKAIEEAMKRRSKL